MDNVYVTQHFDWNAPGSRPIRLVNALLSKLGSATRLTWPSQTGSMTNLEQRLNLFHLVMGVLSYRVPGALVEFGTFRGSSAALMQMVIDQFDPSRRLHVYDTFDDVPAAEVAKTFTDLGLPPPEVHAGDLAATLPAELPEQVCFAHIDLGPARGPEHHAKTLRHCLEALYPRLVPGGVCLLADYCDPDVYSRPGYVRPHAMLSEAFWHLYPHVKRVTDEFLSDKPETAFYLYAGEFSHGFFRKALD